MTAQPFGRWIREQLALDENDPRLERVLTAFDILVCRVDDARRRGAADPLTTISTRGAGGNSRACTRRMLEQTGFESQARRAVHRLLAGSPSGWPGLLRIYAAGDGLTAAQRGYATRQLHNF